MIRNMLNLIYGSWFFFRTNAKLILSYLKDQHPSIYSRITYYLIDSSPTLNKYQKDTFLEGNDNEHEGKVKFILDDLMNISTGE